MTELEKFADQNFAVMKNPTGIILPVAEIFERKGEVIVFLTGWQNPEGTGRPPFHIIEGQVAKIDDKFFIGDNVIYESEGESETDLRLQINQWDIFKQSNEDANRESAEREIERGL